MSAPLKKQPDGYHTVTPSLTVRHAAEALEFYKKALGAEELYRLPSPDGKLLHAEMQIGDSRVMLSDEFPAWQSLSPHTIGGTAGTLMIYVEDVDAAFKKAVDAGAKVTSEPTDQFWGDRVAGILDPYGHKWSLAMHVEDVTPEEIIERAAKMFGGGEE